MSCVVNDVSSGLVYYYPFDQEFSSGDIYKDTTLYTKNIITGKDASMNNCFIYSDSAVGDGALYLHISNTSVVTLEPINIPIFNTINTDNSLSNILIQGITISFFVKNDEGVVNINFSGTIYNTETMVKMRENGRDTYNFIIDLSNYEITVIYGTNGGNIAENADSRYNLTNKIKFYSNTNLKDGNWHHFVISINIPDNIYLISTATSFTYTVTPATYSGPGCAGNTYTYTTCLYGTTIEGINTTHTYQKHAVTCSSKNITGNMSKYETKYVIHIDGEYANIDSSTTPIFPLVMKNPNNSNQASFYFPTPTITSSGTANVDDFRIYNRILTYDEIIQLYQTNTSCVQSESTSTNPITTTTTRPPPMQKSFNPVSVSNLFTTQEYFSTNNNRNTMESFDPLPKLNPLHPTNMTPFTDVSQLFYYKMLNEQLNPNKYVGSSDSDVTRLLSILDIPTLNKYYNKNEIKAAIRKQLFNSFTASPTKPNTVESSSSSSSSSSTSSIFSILSEANISFMGNNNEYSFINAERTTLDGSSSDGSFGNSSYSIKNDIPESNTNNFEISLNHSNDATNIAPRCKFMKTCTLNHFYYLNPKMSYTTDEYGNVSCKCTHDPGNMVLNTNNEIHQHCENTNELPSVQDFLYNNPNKYSNGNGTYDRNPIQSMDVDLTSSSSKSNLITDYIKEYNEQQDGEYNTAINDIVEVAADYYSSLLENKKYGEQLEKIFALNDGSSAYLSDSSEMYKNNFLKIANLSIASVFLLGCIFALSK